MNSQTRSSAICKLLTVGFSLGVVAMPIDDAIAELSEIDVFEQAIASGTEEGVLDFLEAFPSSHLVNDLMELLPPDLAVGVCAGLPDGVGSAARRACSRLQEAVASAPAAGPSADRASASETLAAEDSPLQAETASPATGALDAERKGTDDKAQFLMAGATDDTSTDASIDSRRDGVANDDTADDTADNPTDGTTDDAPDPTDPDDSAADTAGPFASGGEDGGAVGAAGGGDRSEGGAQGGGNEGGGGH